MTGNAQLALDTIRQRPTRGIPTWVIHIMEHSMIERLAGAAPGDYRRDPTRVYLAMQRAVGACMIDQFIPDNPLSMGDQGFEGKEKGATTGAERIVLDSIEINGPEAVVEHLERFEFPRLRKSAAEFDEERRVADILRGEAAAQATLGPDILKAPYAVARFPCFRYGAYGYAPYFMAYALYPEAIERDFALQADLALRNNRAVARAYREGNLPPLLRLDHDMADSRGTLVDVRSLDRLWLPHFARCLEPLLRSGVRLIWHCDGNLMEMVPRLLDVGLRGFQGFQYECGMDYERICRMKARDGSDLLIIAGVSVSTTLPYGTPADVRRELAWLVEAGPPTGLFLGGSSSITPGVPWENIKALTEGLAHFRAHRRAVSSTAVS
jgi:hypothetical protein